MPALKEENIPVSEANSEKADVAEETKKNTLTEKELFVWKSPSRPFKRRDRDFYITVFAIAAIVGLILFLVEGWMPVILIISLIFLFYILNTVEPEEIEYKITDKGVKVAERLTPWEITGRFWFSSRFDSHLLIFETQVLPGRLEIVIKNEDREKLREIISKYIPEEEAAPSILDRSANWFSKKLPGN